MTPFDCFICRECKKEARVRTIDSRPAVVGTTKTVVRKKKCPDCGTTYKTIELPYEVAIDVLEDN